MKFCKETKDSAHVKWELNKDGTVQAYCVKHQGQLTIDGKYKGIDPECMEPEHFIELEPCCKELEQTTYNGNNGIHYKGGEWKVFYDGSYTLMSIKHCPFCGAILPTP